MVVCSNESARDVSGRADLREVPKTMVWETKPEVPMEEKLETKNKDSVFITRQIRFSMKSSEDSVCDDASSDKHPAAITGECNDDPGAGLAGLANHNICENGETSQPAGKFACEEEFGKNSKGNCVDDPEGTGFMFQRLITIVLTISA